MATLQELSAGETLSEGSEPSRFYYGWVMLPVAALLQIGTSVGQTFGVSVFNPYIQKALHLTRSELTGCYLLASLTAAAPMPFLGWLSDRFGLRRVTFGVVVLLGLGCLLISQAHNMVVLTLGFLMLRAFGQGGLTLVASNTLAMWFSRRLGFVSGLSGLGMSAAFAGMPILYLLLIDQLGWRESYIALGLLTWGVLLPLIVVVYRNRPEDVGQHIDGLPGSISKFTKIQGNPRSSVEQDEQALRPQVSPGAADDSLELPEKKRKQLFHRKSEDSTGISIESDKMPVVTEGITGERSYDLRQAWRTRAYWIAAGLVAMWGMIGTGIFFNIVSYYEWKGFTKEDAALTFTTVAISMAVLQFVGGTLADYCPLKFILCASSGGLAMGVTVLLNMDSLWMGHVYAA
ncbi:MAG: MFS transporter, partial [Gemmataceae bacterium]